MDLYLRTGLALVMELLILFVIGGILQPASDEGETSVCETVLAGFVTSLAVMEAVALPSTLLGLGLNTFFLLWAAALSLLLSASCVLRYRGFFRVTAWHARNFRISLSPFLMVAAALALAVLSVFISSDGDTSHVISQAATDLYTGTIGRTDGTSGASLSSMPVADLITRYHLSDEFFSELCDIPVLTQMKLVRQVLTVLLSLMASYRIFYHLMGRSKKKAGWTNLFLMVILLLSATGTSPASELIRDGWTGNASLTGVIFPILILLMLIMTEHPDSLHAKCLLFLTGAGAASLSETAIYLIPVFILFTFLPAVLIRKTWSLIPYVLLALIVPSVCVLLGLIAPVVPL